MQQATIHKIGKVWCVKLWELPPNEPKKLKDICVNPSKRKVKKSVRNFNSFTGSFRKLSTTEVT